MCQLPLLELTWLWWPWGWNGTPAGERKCTRHGTGLPVSASSTVTCTQLRPPSSSSTRTPPSAALPSRSISPQRTRPTALPPCSTVTVADGVAAISV